MFVGTRAYIAHRSSTYNASHILSSENRERTVKVLSSMKVIRTSKETPPKEAAVLVPICLVEREISLLLSVRSMQLKNNRGQVAFPGGMLDSTDASLEETALRETEEEIGMSRDTITVWGKGPSICREDMTVTPYLAYAGEINPNSLRINTSEVESAFTVNLETLCDPKIFRTTRFRSKRGDFVLPTFITPKFRVWGMTALIMHIMLQALLPDQYKNKIPRKVMNSPKLPSLRKH